MLMIGLIESISNHLLICNSFYIDTGGREIDHAKRIYALHNGCIAALEVTKFSRDQRRILPCQISAKRANERGLNRAACAKRRSYALLPFAHDFSEQKLRDFVKS